MVHKKNKKQRTRVEVASTYSEKRESEIINELKFGKPVDQLDDSQLFTVTKKPNNDIKLLSKKEAKKQEARNRTTFADRILRGNENVLPISKTNAGSKPIEPDRLILKKKIKQVTQQQEESDDDDFLDDDLKKKKNLKKRKAAADDQSIWDHDDNAQYSEVSQFVKDEVKKQTFKVPTHKPLVANMKSLELPKPGMSYNPDKAQHQEVLADAIKVELTAQRYVNRVTKRLEIQGDDNDEELEDEKKQKAAALEEEEQEESDSDSDSEEKSLNIAQINALQERVTRKQKNARLRNAENIRKQVANQLKKKQSKHIEKSSGMVDVIEKHEEHVNKRLENRKKLHDDRNTKTKKIGRYNVTLETEPVLLTDELPKSLKNLSNVHFNPLEDRFRSLQKRSIVEGYGPKGEATVGRKKVYTRHSYNNTTPL
ncbi:hypothetical protein PPL_00505 [Heterostelium album PN500]|uniref:Ribosome biogenesis protein NOP53 n=1 Tax=Heterostelium pallidum (strain ATCC 26659 / Pp 5 / PN500) TaxID=670386 RepID=D3AWM9_HETP5|nr:hypothetical protein PPL_00505 [Heterostelium album PN500]EFA86702.1 hypothetical protein PPL_00505 [Heterostelium album PN500]|eukprot:XP_020438806.1 hypothetical protein PPL_00505 [Heterostelium album PN500]